MYLLEFGVNSFFLVQLPHHIYRHILAKLVYLLPHNFIKHIPNNFQVFPAIQINCTHQRLEQIP